MKFDQIRVGDVFENRYSKERIVVTGIVEDYFERDAVHMIWNNGLTTSIFPSAWFIIMEDFKLISRNSRVTVKVEK